MNEPLDLRALQARLKFGDSLDAAECGALVAALREMRVALAKFLSYHNSIEVPHGCFCERCQWGRAAFAQVWDEPQAFAAPIGQEEGTRMTREFEQRVAAALRLELRRHGREFFGISVAEIFAPLFVAALEMANRTGREWNVVYEEMLARNPQRPGINWEDAVLATLRRGGDNERV